MSGETDSDYNDLKVELLLRIQRSLEAQEGKLTDVRERLIRLEAHGYSERISQLENEISTLKGSVIVLQTQGKFFTAGIAAVVSAITAIIVKFIGGVAPV